MSSEQPDRNWCRLTMPNDLAYVSVVQSFVCNVAVHFGFARDALQGVELAVEEAVANVIEEAFSPDEVAHFDVSCRQIPNGIEIVIHDNGLPYDPALASEYDPHAAIESQEAAGLGHFLIRKSMDAYEFRNLGTEGKETRMVKYVSSLNIADEAPGKEPETPEPPPSEPPAEMADFEVRRMQRSEAIEVARCVYDAYGYSYANEHVYYPERVAAMNEDGQLLSAVAVTESGEMGGHAALIFHEHFAPELGIAVVKKKYRGCKLASRLGEFLVEQALARNISRLQVKQVTVHPYTQKFCRKQGYLDCGFLLAHSPKTLSFKGIADQLEQRNSDVVGFRYLQPPTPATVYLPPRHADMIRRLYANLQAPIEEPAPGDAEDGTGEGETVMNSTVNSLRALAEIRIPHYGADAIGSIKHELRRLRLEEVRVVELFLGLTDPMTAKLTPELEELGFFFTGLMPGADGGDAMIMQLFNGVCIDYGALQIVSDTATKLLAYIAKIDPYAG